jgi:DNA-binding PadR family transcriptional regulator
MRAPAVYTHDEYIHIGYNRGMSDRFLAFTRDEVDALLPLAPATFHILLALADEDRHGYGIIQDVAARTDGALRLSPGTLYRSLQRMLEQGLVLETSDRPAPEFDDERRRYYRITPLGTAVAKAEARRLSDLVRMARARGLAPAKG